MTNTVPPIPTELLDGLTAATENDTQDSHSLPWVDLHELFAGEVSEDAIVDGFLYPGRWTSIFAGPKTGKSTLALTVAMNLVTGHDPFTGTPQNPITVAYLDAEMGRGDIRQRIEDEHGLGPNDLTHFRYLDMPPKLDDQTGAAELVTDLTRQPAQVVILDGINGFITGNENDNEHWIRLFEYAIRPLKNQDIAILSCDNSGKDPSLGARGGSAKRDKPDAVIELAKADRGVTLKTTHRRWWVYPDETQLEITGLDGTGTVTYRQRADSWPEGTAAKADQLDQINAPLDITRRKARQLLTDAGHTPGQNKVLAAAIRYRKIPEYAIRNEPK